MLIEYAMSQYEVAKKMNMAQQTIGRIERKAMEKFKALFSIRAIV